jgi:acetyl/propionyl-CoA carboxylase alpha subunit
MITGLDLVEEQIKIAQGNALSFKQNDLKIEGHAIELRVYAEDPQNSFLPSIGRLNKYQIPDIEGVRVDDGFREGMDVPIYYDPMIAKLIVHANNRKEAIQLIKNAIKTYKIEGVATTLPFGTFVFNHAAFISGNFDTHFVQKYYDVESLQIANKKLAKIAGIVALKYWLSAQNTFNLPNSFSSNWPNRND